MGDDDVVFKKATYETSCKCITTYAEVFEINKDDFIKFRQMGNVSFWEAIEETVIDKKTRIHEMILNNAHQEKILEQPSKYMKDEKPKAN